MDPMIGAALIGAGTTGLGMIGEGKRYRRNLQGQKDLMDIQNQNQKGLNKQAHGLSFDMWKKTNYPAQVEMLKEAGLNPALIYGSAGAGGTTQAGAGGNAAGGSAPNQYQPMDMSNMLMGAQAGKLLAETNKIKEETTETKETIANIIADTNNKKLEAKLKEVEGWMSELNYEFAKESFNERLDNVGETLKQLKLSNDLTEEQWDDLVKEQAGKASSAMNNSRWIDSNVKLNNKELDAFETKLEDILNQTSIKQQNAWSKELEIQITEELGKMNIDQRKKEMWVKAGSALIRDLLGFGSGFVTKKSELL